MPIMHTTNTLQSFIVFSVTSGGVTNQKVETTWEQLQGAFYSLARKYKETLDLS